MTAAERNPSQRQPARAAIASLVGTALEWYDFYLYATAAALVFGPVFFPGQTPLLATMASFGTFAVGFVARPLGALLFGHIGDVAGRKPALILTLVLMGSGTFMIGVLPGYDDIGVWAPLSLVALRFIQGVAVGGEWGGAVLIAREHAPDGRQAWFASFAQLGSPIGLLMSVLAFRMISTLDDSVFLTWGWRLPFIGSLGLIAVAWFVRSGLNESLHQDERRTPHTPMRDVFGGAMPLVLLAAGACAAGIAGVYVVNTFMLAYSTTHLGLERTLVLDCLTIAAVIQIVVQITAARMGDRIGLAKCLIGFLIIALPTPFIMYPLVKTGTPLLVLAGLSLPIIGLGGYYSLLSGFISSIFPERIRYTAISVSYHFCGTIAGGLTPVICTALVYEWPDTWLPLAIFFDFIIIISIISSAVILRRMRSVDPNQMILQPTAGRL